MKMIIIGPQGSGKGSYASRLSQIFGIPHISTGDICREESNAKTSLGKEIEKYMNVGKLVPDEIILQIVKKRLEKPDCKKGFIFDGFPRTIKQAEALGKITDIDIVLELDAPEWLLLKRLSNRRVCEKCEEIYNLLNVKPKKEGICDKCGGELIQRADETSAAIKERLVEYKENTEPLIGFYNKKGKLKKYFCDKFESSPEENVNGILKVLGVKNV